MLRKKTVTGTFFVMGVLLLFVILVAGINIVNHIDDAYAQWGAADMVIDYMRDHHDAWPPNWNALQSYFTKNNGRVGGWSFDEFQSRVYIDFSADSQTLRRLSLTTDYVPFNVIDSTSIWGTQMGDGPNDMIYRYFKNENDAQL